jgi:hypothetical protein
MAKTLRKRIEIVSAPALIRIHSLPRAVVLVVMIGFMLIGVVQDDALGGSALLAVAAFVGWLLYLSWPLLESRARLLRAIAVLLIVLAAVSKFVAN